MKECPAVETHGRLSQLFLHHRTVLVFHRHGFRLCIVDLICVLMIYAKLEIVDARLE